MKAGQRLRQTRRRAPLQQQETNVQLPLNLEHLELGLRQAMLEMQTNSRVGTLTAVRTVIDFIHSIPGFGQQNLTTPMLILLMALHDLDAGLVVPNARPRRREATIRKVVKSYAAAYVVRYASSMSASARPVPSLRRRVCGSLIPPDRNML